MLVQTSRSVRRSAVVVVAIGVLYVASFGPACWIACRTNPDLPAIYLPIGYATARWQLAFDLFLGYGLLGIPNGSAAHVPILCDSEGNITRAIVRPVAGPLSQPVRR